MTRSTNETKDTNPKDALGIMKAYRSVLPIRVLWYVAVAFVEGACEYGRHNYRLAGVRASVYYDAAGRHMDAWWEGQDIDPKSGLNHIDKAIASMFVLRDSMLEGNWVDDRPPAVPNDFIADLNEVTEKLLHRIEKRTAPYTEIRKREEMPENTSRVNMKGILFPPKDVGPQFPMKDPSPPVGPSGQTIGRDICP